MSELLNKETVKRVEKSLKDFDENLKVIALDQTARTAKDAASSLKCELGAIVKSLVFKAENEFIVCLVSGDKRCSLNKLKKILNKKDVAMANANEVKDHTGFSIGGVSPTGYLKKLNTYFRESLVIELNWKENIEYETVENNFELSEKISILSLLKKYFSKRIRFLFNVKRN